MTKLLVCIDGSAYADNICVQAAWAAKILDADVDLLHVLRRHSDYEAPVDHTGAIGLGAKSGLLDELTKIDEERGRLDQQRGKLILDHGVEVLKDAGVKNVNVFHRRGSLLEAIEDLEPSCDMVFIGKRGEDAQIDSTLLGSNLEKVARAVTKPLFVMSYHVRPIKRFLIAYDGKGSIQKAIDYIITQPLLKGIDCHLLCVDSGSGSIQTDDAERALKDSGFDVTVKVEQGTQVDEVISSYVEKNEIDLLVAGAYEHSRIRSFLLGSTTSALITSCKIPIFLFR